MRTDIGILSPDSVSMYTQATDRCWDDVYSAPNGATATRSQLVGFKLSCVATSSVMNERCKPSSNKMLPLIRKPSALIGARAVFSKLIVLVVGGHLLGCESYNTGAIVMRVCVGVLVSIDGNVLFASLFLLSLCLGSSR